MLFFDKFCKNGNGNFTSSTRIVYKKGRKKPQLHSENYKFYANLVFITRNRIFLLDIYVFNPYKQQTAQKCVCLQNYVSIYAFICMHYMKKSRTVFMTLLQVQFRQATYTWFFPGIYSFFLCDFTAFKEKRVPSIVCQVVLLLCWITFS